jgi:mannose-6-phosphate isomerase-like protein (cupin superfamily)
VLPVGDAYASERGTRIEITDRDGPVMSFERRYAPDTGRADPHYHLDFTQTWEALGGEGVIEVDGEERPFVRGDRAQVEPGTPHRDPWNPGDGRLVVRGTFDPCTAFIEGYAEAWAHHFSEGTVNDQDEMPLMQILLIAKETGGKSYRAGVPKALQDLSLPLVAAIARMRGFRAAYD